jgi:hypothetical protein
MKSCLWKKKGKEQIMNDRNRQPRIVSPEGHPFMQPHQISDRELSIMKHQGLCQIWAQYAELLRRSDIDGKEELAAAASSRAVDYMKVVIDEAEKDLEEGEKDATSKR